MKPVSILILGITAASVIAGCRGDDGDGNIDEEYVGDVCDDASECYPEIAADALSGEVICLTRVEGGYCTHECESDTDCCAAEGECVTGLEQVCAPLESEEEMFCLVTCEQTAESDDYCETEVHPAFHCRSTGGGSENRRVCLPN
jgi:hypothetical protein